MGEIDTKAIESVETAITFFGQSNEQRRNSPSNGKEVDTERELASVRVQLEAKEAVHKQALVKLDHYQKTAEELSTLLKNSDVKKNLYINQSREAIARVAHLESALQNKSERLNELERQILEKSANIDSLQLGVHHTKELAIMSEVSCAEAALEVDMMKEEMESNMNEVEALRSQVERVKRELEKSREVENEAQVEIALLKFQLHKGRSRLAAAEAAEARAQSEKTALYNALQQMGLEAEETKKENRMLLKEAAKLAHPHEDLIMSNEELEDVKRELGVALSKIGELRARAEQATSRAEAAERALEEQNSKRREHKERRKAALAALSREFQRKSIRDDEEEEGDSAKIYQPLGKVLNMKF